MLLDNFCILDVACCTPRSTILEAAHLMRKRHTGDLVVVEDDEDRQEPLGVITDRMRVHGVRRMPVVGSRGKLVGIVTVDDMLKRLALETNVLTEIVSPSNAKRSGADADAALWGDIAVSTDRPSAQYVFPAGSIAMKLSPSARCGDGAWRSNPLRFSWSTMTAPCAVRSACCSNR